MKKLLESVDGVLLSFCESINPNQIKSATEHYV